MFIADALAAALTSPTFPVTFMVVSFGIILLILWWPLIQGVWRQIVAEETGTDAFGFPANLALTDLAKHFRRSGTCPDCGHDKFLWGPEGGGMQNIKCANDKCASEFNYSPYIVERIRR